MPHLLSALDSECPLLADTVAQGFLGDGTPKAARHRREVAHIPLTTRTRQMIASWPVVCCRGYTWLRASIEGSSHAYRNIASEHWLLSASPLCVESHHLVEMVYVAGCDCGNGPFRNSVHHVDMASHDSLKLVANDVSIVVTSMYTNRE